MRIEKNKLEIYWLGPYEIVEINEPVNITIRKNNKLFRIHMSHLKLSKDDQQ